MKPACFYRGVRPVVSVNFLPIASGCMALKLKMIGAIFFPAGFAKLRNMIFPYDKGESLKNEIERLFRMRLGDELFNLLEKLEKREGVTDGAMERAGLHGMGGQSKR